MAGQRGAPVESLQDVVEIELQPWEARRPARSTYELIRRSAVAFGAREALGAIATGEIDATETTISFAGLAKKVTQTANLFTRLGCGVTEPVAILLPSVLEAHVAVWAAESAAIACPLNPHLGIEQLSAILRTTRSRYLVAPSRALHDEIGGKADALASLLPGLTLIEVGDRSGSARETLNFADADHENADRLLRGSPPEGRDIASYFATGGTTGAPKIAAHTHDNEVYCAWATVRTLGLDERDVLLCGLPLFHVNALMLTGLAGFLAGAKSVLLGTAGYRTSGVIENFFAHARRFGATVFSGVPTVYGQLLDRSAHPAGGTRLRYGICGAAPISRDLFAEFQRKTGVNIVEGYGLTEGTCVTSLNPPNGEARIGSVGLRLPYQELRIVDATGDEQAADIVGRLLMRGPQVFPGYLEAGALIAPEPWFDTGDLARIDPDGYVWLAGRSKDVIIRGGHNIDPALAEDALFRHPAVRQAAVVGRVDERLGEVPVAYVSLKPGERVTPGELLDFCAARTSERAAVPLTIDIVEALPLTAVGKIFKPVLRERAARDALSAKLLAVGWQSSVKVTTDARRGLVARLRLAPELVAQASHVLQALGRFPLVIEMETDVEDAKS